MPAEPTMEYLRRMRVRMLNALAEHTAMMAGQQVLCEGCLLLAEEIELWPCREAVYAVKQLHMLRGKLPVDWDQA